MTVLGQIIWGITVLVVCSALHVGAIGLAIRAIPSTLGWLRLSLPFFSIILTVSFALSLVVVAHLLQVAIWANVFIWQDIFAEIEPAIYFSLVTYTTLGYGDIILEPGQRILASFASVTGFMTFGLSTAFLVSLLSRLLESKAD